MTAEVEAEIELPAKRRPRSVSAQEATFRHAFREVSSSVSVVTAGGWRPAGFTATSLTSVSLQPLLVSFNISRSASSWPRVQRCDHLAAHVLHSGQHEIARIFATSGINRFAATPEHWQIGPHGIPLLEDYLVRLILRVQNRITAGDSAVVVAEVIDLGHRPGQPLVYRAGHYA